MNKKIIIIVLMMVALVVSLSGCTTSNTDLTQGRLLKVQEDNETLYLAVETSFLSDDITWIKVDDYRIDPTPYINQEIMITMQGSTLIEIQECDLILTTGDYSFIGVWIGICIIIGAVILGVMWIISDIVKAVKR